MKITINDVSEIVENANNAINSANDAVNNANNAVNNANKAIEQFKEENPGVDIDALLSEQMVLPQAIGQIANREVDKFVAKAKKQGIKMPFNSIEMGILAAGRKDAQNGLVEILNAIAPSKPTCPKCKEELENRGRSKKKL